MKKPLPAKVTFLLTLAMAMIGCQLSTSSNDMALLWPFDDEVVSELQLIDRIGAYGTSQLATAEMFAFGPVGYAGQITDAEKAFSEIMGKYGDLAEPALLHVYLNGTTSAKLYALAGLRHMKSKYYRMAAADFVATPKHVYELRGCVAVSMQGREALNAIEKDTYSEYISSLLAQRRNVAIPTSDHLTRDRRSKGLLNRRLE